MKKQATNKPSALSVITTAFARYHLTIFTVVLVSGLATAVLLLNSILTQSSDISGYTSTLDVTTFDQTTIDRVSQLKSSNDSLPTFTLPAGRTNPFAE